MLGEVEVLSCGTPQEWCVEGLPVLTAQGALPHWKGRGGRRFNRYYRAYGDAFFAYCRTELLPRATVLAQEALLRGAVAPAWHASLQTTLTLQSAPYLSLYTQSTETDDRCRLVLRRGDTWDLCTGYPVPARTFLGKGHLSERVIAVFTEKIRREEAAGIARYDADWQQKLRKHYSAERFYLAPDGVHFFYQMYQLSGAAEGLPEVVLPYDAAIFAPSAPVGADAAPV